jgi:hypothetical protein
VIVVSYPPIIQYKVPKRLLVTIKELLEERGFTCSVESDDLVVCVVTEGRTIVIYEIRGE